MDLGLIISSWTASRFTLGSQRRQTVDALGSHRRQTVEGGHDGRCFPPLGSGGYY